MRLSKKAEYALRALIHASRFPEGTTFQIKELAEKNRIPKKFLELILLELKNNGIMRSKRGVGGGYLLSRRPETILSSEIIRAIEGPVEQTGRRRGTGVSADAEDRSPAVARLLRETSEAIGEVLDRWTLADLAREEREAEERKSGNVIYHI